MLFIKYLPILGVSRIVMVSFELVLLQGDIGPTFDVLFQKAMIGITWDVILKFGGDVLILKREW